MCTCWIELRDINERRIRSKYLKKHLRVLAQVRCIRVDEFLDRFTFQEKCYVGVSLAPRARHSFPYHCEENRLPVLDFSTRWKSCGNRYFSPQFLRKRLSSDCIRYFFILYHLNTFSGFYFKFSQLAARICSFLFHYYAVSHTSCFFLTLSTALAPILIGAVRFTNVCKSRAISFSFLILCFSFVCWLLFCFLFFYLAIRRLPAGSRRIGGDRDVGALLAALLPAADDATAAASAGRGSGGRPSAAAASVVSDLLAFRLAGLRSQAAPAAGPVDVVAPLVDADHDADHPAAEQRPAPLQGRRRAGRGRRPPDLAAGASILRLEPPERMPFLVN